MSERGDVQEEPAWLFERDQCEDWPDIRIKTKVNDNGQLTLIDSDASSFMEQTERWLTFQDGDNWLLDLEDCR